MVVVVVVGSLLSSWLRLWLSSLKVLLDELILKLMELVLLFLLELPDALNLSLELLDLSHELLSHLRSGDGLDCGGCVKSSSSLSDVSGDVGGLSNVSRLGNVGRFSGVGLSFRDHWLNWGGSESWCWSSGWGWGSSWSWGLLSSSFSWSSNLDWSVDKWNVPLSIWSQLGSVLSGVFGLSWNGEVWHVLLKVIVPSVLPVFLARLEVSMGGFDVLIKSLLIGIWVLNDLSLSLGELHLRGLLSGSKDWVGGKLSESDWVGVNWAD